MSYQEAQAARYPLVLRSLSLAVPGCETRDYAYFTLNAARLACVLGMNTSLPKAGHESPLQKAGRLAECRIDQHDTTFPALATIIWHRTRTWSRTYDLELYERFPGR